MAICPPYAAGYAFFDGTIYSRDINGISAASSIRSALVFVIMPFSRQQFRNVFRITGRRRIKDNHDEVTSPTIIDWLYRNRIILKGT